MAESTESTELIMKVTSPSPQPVKTFKAAGLYFMYDEKIQDDYDPIPILRDLPRMKGRQDDVIVCGCHRSGTNWTWEIVNMLVRKEAQYQKDRKTPTLFEFSPQKYFDDLPSPRVLSTHLRFQHIPDDMKSKRCKIIYVQRNPKDVAVSLPKYVHSEFDIEVPWDEYVRAFLNFDEDDYVSWVGATKSWEKAIEDNPDYPIFLFYYEDMKRNPVKEITRMAKFLGSPTDDKFIKDIVDKTTFSNMKTAKLDFLSNGTPCAPEEEDTFKRREKYYRKGEVGDWKNHFTVAQNEYFDETLTRKMKDSKHNFIYTM